MPDLGTAAAAGWGERGGDLLYSGALLLPRPPTTQGTNPCSPRLLPRPAGVPNSSQAGEDDDEGGQGPDLELTHRTKLPASCLPAMAPFPAGKKRGANCNCCLRRWR